MKDVQYIINQIPASECDPEWTCDFCEGGTRPMFVFEILVQDGIERIICNECMHDLQTMINKVMERH